MGGGAGTHGSGGSSGSATGGGSGAVGGGSGDGGRDAGDGGDGGDGGAADSGAVLLVFDRISIGSDGGEGNSDSNEAFFSTDGRHVIFESGSDNLVPGDTNHADDVFARDLQTGVTTRVSLAFDGTQGDLGAGILGLSADGRQVLFRSESTNLVAGGSGPDGLYVFDRDVDGDGMFDQPGHTTTHLVSVDTTGVGIEWIGPAAGAMSSDARDVLLVGGPGANPGTFVRERDLAGTGAFDQPGNSATVALLTGLQSGSSFDSTARSLVFVGVADAGVPCSPDGNLGVYVHDRDVSHSGTFDNPGNTRDVCVSQTASQNPNLVLGGNPVISASGRFVLFTSNAEDLVPNDTNGVTDAFVVDRDSDRNGVFDEPNGVSVKRLSVGDDGTQGNKAVESIDMSADGRMVAFTTASNTLSPLKNRPTVNPDVFVVDRDSDGNGVFDEPGTTRIAMVVGNSGIPGNDWSRSGKLSPDGRWIAISSAASNLIPADHNGKDDVFRARTQRP